MPNRPEPAVGIDLGTTNSVIAHLDATGRPTTLLNEEGDLTTPSVVLFDDASVVVGREALKVAMIEPHRVAQFAKRDLGQATYHRPIEGVLLGPEVVQALVLRKLRHDAQLRLGPLTKAVVTVPAYFNEPRRKATQDAGAMAGLDVIDIINEPTAAALAHGVQQGFLSPHGIARRRETVMVYDLGGGTFDVTLMAIDGSDYRTIATSGDVLLGGLDWDERIADDLADAFEQLHEVDPRTTATAWEEVLQLAGEAKRALSAREETTVHLNHQGQRCRRSITRRHFESLTADLLDRTRLTAVQVLRDARLRWRDISRLILVGGSTRMPMVREMLEGESGIVVDRSLSPDEAVAHGAAIYARIVLGQAVKENGADMSVQNASSHDLGVLGIDRRTRRPRRRTMIGRNSPLPASATAEFQTARQGQANVTVRVIEGGTDSGKHATPIGTCQVGDLPAGLPAGTPVKVTFCYASDGRLTVHAWLPTVKRKATLKIERAAGMSREALQLWQARIEDGFRLADISSATDAQSHRETEDETNRARIDWDEVRDIEDMGDLIDQLEDDGR